MNTVKGFQFNNFKKMIKVKDEKISWCKLKTDIQTSRSASCSSVLLFLEKL